jgi:hypothetical protein
VQEDAREQASLSARAEEGKQEWSLGSHIAYVETIIAIYAPSRKADLPGILTTEVAEKTHGKTASGVPITNKLVAKLADKAEAGYNVDAMLRRRGGRRVT